MCVFQHKAVPLNTRMLIRHGVGSSAHYLAMIEFLNRVASITENHSICQKLV